MTLAWPVPQAGDRRIDALLAGSSWVEAPGSPITLTYAFPERADSYPSPYSAIDEPRYEFTPLSAVQRMAVREALDLWAAVAHVRFVESDERTGPATLRFAATGLAATAQAYLPGDDPAAGDVWLSTNLPTEFGYRHGSYEFFVLIHEIGHALGLKHPHEGESASVTLAKADDHLGFTVMSYRAFPGASIARPFLGNDFPSTPMLGDIAAVQYLFGPAPATAAGDDLYRFQAGERIWRTIYDTGGTDTLDLSELLDGVLLDLRPGSMSAVGPPADTGGPPQKFTLGIAPGTVIERAIGTERPDRLIGNDADNWLAGGAGRDRIEGMAGDDVLLPQAGNDRVMGGAGVDRVVLDGRRADFAIAIKGQGVVVRDLRAGAPEGRDRLESIELLEFTDGVVSLPSLEAGLYERPESLAALLFGSTSEPAAPFG